MGKYALESYSRQRCCFTTICIAICMELAWLSAPERNGAAAAQLASQGTDSGSQNVVPNRITGFTSWDDDYFYVAAVQATKPRLSGSNTCSVFSDPLSDDAVVVSIQIG